MLQIGNGGTTGSISDSSPVTDDASLVFDRSDTYVYGGLVSGAGSLTQAGAGPLVLTGSNTYTGGTLVSAGTLQVGNGGTSGAIGPGGVANYGSLVFNLANSYTPGGVISGPGDLFQNGQGTVILTSPETYTGTTTINSGTLQVDNGGNMGSSLPVRILWTTAYWRSVARTPRPTIPVPSAATAPSCTLAAEF